MIPRKKGLKRTPVKRVNVTRRAASFARCYGSKERVEWINSLPCAFYWIARQYGVGLGHCLPPIQNCHTGKHGMGTKNAASTIVPGCTSHHPKFDRYEGPFGRESLAREAIYTYAAELDAHWLATHPKTNG